MAAKSRPKPRGVNVRAFIENVERGKKPQPDFFTPTVETGASPRSSTCTAAERPWIPPKPLATHTKPQHSPKPTPHIEHSGTLQDGGTSSITEDDDVACGDIRCPSEDSGHSTCDLKYSGMYIQ